MKVVVLCPYPVGCAPSQRLKFEQYYDSWREQGYVVDVRPFWDPRTWAVLYEHGHRLRKMLGFARASARRVGDLAAALRADLVYVHLEAVPLGPPLLERVIAWRRVPIVYDIDDLKFVRHSSESNRFMRWARHGKKYGRLMALATEVIVCTEYLERYARRFNHRVTNISSTIDTDTYVPRNPRSPSQPVVVGWSGSPSTAPFLHLLDGVLRAIQDADRVEIRVIGDSAFTIPGVRLRASDWRLESEVADLLDLDIGLYPLPDDEWVLGKSGLKALQYMALGIATVAQRTPVNETLIDDGVNGFLATDADDWMSIVTKLVRDPDLRASVAAPARRTVEERYSVRATAPCYLAVLDRAVRAH